MSFKMLKQDRDYTEDEILRMVISLRSGNRERVIPLIKAHMTLANQIAGYFTKHNVNRREDLYAVAFWGLCGAINRADVRLVDNNITAYAARCIKGAIQTFLTTDCLIPIPRREFKKRMEKEDPLSFTLRTGGTGGGLEIMDREVHTAGVIENIAIILPLSNSMMQNIDVPVADYSLQKMEDLYAKMQLTETEVTVIDFRLDGLTFKEIGKEMGISDVMVYYHIQNIKSKIAKLGLKMPNHTPDISGTKVCSRCQNERSLSYFYKIGEGSYKSICKICMKEAYVAKTASIH